MNKHVSRIGFLVLGITVWLLLWLAGEATPILFFGDVPAEVQDQEASIKDIADDEKDTEVVDQEPAHSAFYRVIKVIDGDTIDVEYRGVTTRVRLIGVDTPESVDPRTRVECFGKESAVRASELMLNKEIALEQDPSQGERDRYGRLLAYIFLQDGTNVNKLLIEEGYAHEYTYNKSYKYQQEFKAAEEKARLEKRGLWAEKACK